MCITVLATMEEEKEKRDEKIKVPALSELSV